MNRLMQNAIEQAKAEVKAEAEQKFEERLKAVTVDVKDADFEDGT